MHTAELLVRLTGAEAAIVVNNCAAAVLVTLAALARGGEVIVSRGELIEIGDGFRIPEIMEQSGALLREVGTTNRTHLADYENAINDKTRLLLSVHPSNFKVTGFTDKPSLEELVALSGRSGLPLVEDLGSGCLVDLSEHGVSEPTVRQSVEAGVSLVMFSGDKLLGGPQAGIIAGKKELVARVRRYPLFRALRVDKLTIAALEATLGAYLAGGLGGDSGDSNDSDDSTGTETAGGEFYSASYGRNSRWMRWRLKLRMGLRWRGAVYAGAVFADESDSNCKCAVFRGKARTTAAAGAGGNFRDCASGGGAIDPRPAHCFPRARTTVGKDLSRRAPLASKFGAISLRIRRRKVTKERERTPQTSNGQKRDRLENVT